MDKLVREVIEKELVTIKARIVLQETQAAVLDEMVIPGAQAEQIAATKTQTKAQLTFDKAYAKKIEELLQNDVVVEEVK